MKAGEATVIEMLESKHVYEVPRYQRRYVWDEVPQWEPLWHDVRQIAEDSLQRRLDRSGNGVPRMPHFMGAVVVKRKSIDDISGNNLPTWIVVDGQQRLTTILLMMRAFSNVL